MNPTNQRAVALDALRGYAIFTMILSGSIVFGILPGWMYHAQVPPPLHQFIPSIPGITWVDLVFPFFLFAMGAAFPFAMTKKIDSGVSKTRLVVDVLIRGLQLAFFAIFIEHMFSYNISSPPDNRAWLISLSAFVLMFVMFMKLPWTLSETWQWLIKIGGFVVSMILMLTITYAKNRQFSLDSCDVIILILANVSVFGSIIWLFTRGKPMYRIAILPFIMAIFLSSGIEGSWAKWVFNLTPFPWLYRFDFLKYLFIIIPGTIAGEYMMEWIRANKNNQTNSLSGKTNSALLLTDLLLLIVLNVVFLYARYLVLNLVTSISLLSVAYVLIKKEQSNYAPLWRNLFIAGMYLLLLGLFFEAFEGGIKKDFATFSYYFVTSGLAFLSLIIFSIFCDYWKYQKGLSFLILSGQNPMIAYVSGSLVLWPLLGLTRLDHILNLMNVNPWFGFLKGVIFTMIVMLFASFFTKKKIFWRT